ncbi:MAG: homoserine kinase [Trueperella sp.]|nr:homoserine kinase [Trueperella sp.]
MRIATNSARVRVPATSGNLGPGFDAMGMAHDLWDDVSVRVTTGASAVEIRGEGADTLPRDESHLILQAMYATLDRIQAPHAGFELICHNNIPQGRGLGSSAAAIVAGIMLVRGLIDHPQELDDDLVLQIATELEGHPDNAAPAIFGGAVLSWSSGEKTHSVHLQVRPDIHTTLLVPREVLATSAARAALPVQVPHADGAFNSARAALLVHALARAPQLLFDATEERLHQGYRAESMPHSARVLAALRNAGWPAVVSGAGPSLLVFAKLDERITQVLAAEGFRAIPSQQVRGAYLI